MYGGGQQPHTPPPEGVTTGASIPRENEQESIEESAIEGAKNALLARGEPYTEMNEDELRERAVDLLQRVGAVD